MSTRGEPPSVAVAGWIGSTNLGDELIAAVLLKRLHARGLTTVVPSLHPARTRRQHATQAVAHRALGANRDAIRRAQMLVFGGGSLIQDMTSQLNLPYHLSRPWYASKVGVPFAGIGLDAGPLASRWGRRLTRRVLRSAEVIGVRNIESAQLLRSIGLERVVETADLALAHTVQDRSPADRIAVCFRPPVLGGVRPVASRSRIQDDSWIRAAARALDEVSLDTGLAIQFVAMQTDRDRSVHDAIHETMRSEATHADPTLETVYQTIADARVVVAMRYHGGIGAVVGARPAVMLGYSSKVDSLVRQVGTGFVGLTTDENALASIRRSVATALDQAEHMVDARTRLQALEARNEDILDQLLAARR